MKNALCFFSLKNLAKAISGQFFVTVLLFSGGLLAAPVKLSDVPLGTETRVPPTIVMTADDSGSMRRTYTPDNLNEIGNACWENGSPRKCVMTAAASNSIITVNEGLCQDQQPPMLAAAFNGLAYDPLIDYDPPVNGDGVPFPK